MFIKLVLVITSEGALPARISLGMGVREQMVVQDALGTKRKVASVHGALVRLLVIMTV